MSIVKEVGLSVIILFLFIIAEKQDADETSTL